jgi:hypothetical protein
MARRTNTEDPAGTPAYEASDTGAHDSSSSSAIADSAKQAATQAKEAAGRAIDQAKSEVASRADQQRESAATGFQAVAHAFRNMGDDLRNQEQGPVAQYAAEIGNAMGSQVERFANYLRGRDVHQLITDAEDFARRSPALFLGGAFVLGLATSRFLKSSRPESRSVSRSSQGPETDAQRFLPPASRPIESPYTAPRYSDPIDRNTPAGEPGFGGGLDPAGRL